MCVVVATVKIIVVVTAAGEAASITRYACEETIKNQYSDEISISINL